MNHLGKSGRLITTIYLCLSMMTVSAMGEMSVSILCDTYPVQAKKVQLLDQQVAVLVGLYVNPNWVKQQSAQNQLVYGVVKPSDTVPSGVKDYSFLVSSSDEKQVYLFFKTTGHRVIIKYANHGNHLHTKVISLAKLEKKTYHTKQQRKVANQYVSSLRTE